VRWTWLAFAIAALLAVLAPAGTAHADSIAYVKAGDVWLSTSDGGCSLSSVARNSTVSR
jgi:hypothetical protein